MTAIWLAGRTWYNAVYHHAYNQSYATTGFSISETGENDHVQFTDAATTVSHAAADSDAAWDVSWNTSGTVSGGTTSGGSCGYYLCGNYCTSQCGSLQAFGYMPSVSDQISNFRVLSYLGAGVSLSGGNLSVQP